MEILYMQAVKGVNYIVTSLMHGIRINMMMMVMKTAKMIINLLFN
jgi:hypothetical protein